MYDVVCWAYDACLFDYTIVFDVCMIRSMCACFVCMVCVCALFVVCILCMSCV